MLWLDTLWVDVPWAELVWVEAVVDIEVPVLLKSPTLLELGAEEAVALTVLDADDVVALEAVVLAETVARLDIVAEAELV